jgi:molybdate transport system substrate-binding protein
MKKLLVTLALLAASSLGSVVHGEEVIVFAAASLKDALVELTPLCTNAINVTLVPNLAASGILAQQIRAGAPGDLFISADEATMDGLEKAGLLQAGTRADLLSNALVFIVPANSTVKVDSAKALLDPAIKRIGIGEPNTVPAGHYAVDFLTSQKVIDEVRPKLVPLENVRAVLAAVESGNLDLGIVYRSDAQASSKSKIAWPVPVALGPKIVYPLAVVKNTKNLATATKARDFLLSQAAQKILLKWGFAPPPAPASTPSTAPRAAP